jgi:large subunit ribosomal protein L24
MQAVRVVTKPSKQRKRLYQAPDHVRYKLFAASLSPELKGTHGMRTLPVRTGDTVRIMRGDHKGFEGKITRIDRGIFRIYVEGLTREKVDGTTIFVPVHPSKVMVTNLNLDDKWRKKILERKKEAHRKIEERVATEKLPEEKVVKEEAPTLTEQKPPKKKPKRARRKVAKKPVAQEAKEKARKTKKEKKLKEKKPRAKRKAANKSEGGT